MATTAALAAVTGVTAVVGPAAPASALTTGAAPGRQDPLAGTWRTDGYGMIIVIGHHRGDVYQTTAVSCLPAGQAEQIGPAGRHGVVRFGTGGVTTTLVWPAGRNRGWIHPLGSAGNIGMHRISALPARCTRPARTDPVTSFTIFARTFAENYPFFAAQRINWRATVARYRSQVSARTSRSELFSILVAMIRPLHNAHTDVLAADRRHYFEGLRPGTRPWSAALCARARRATDRHLGIRPRTWGHGNVADASLPGQIGYLRISAFMAYHGDGTTFQADAAVLRRALDAVFTRSRTRSLRGLIVDVRCNPGGNDALGLQVAARLTGKPYLAYTKRARLSLPGPNRFTRTQPIVVRPARAADYTGPIVMLTSGLTNSAGETFTQAMMGRSPAPVRIGTTTQGVFSDVLNRELPDGILFGLPDEEFLIRDGQTFDNRGIPPDIAVAVFTSRQLARHLDPAVDAALRVLDRPATRP